MTDTKKGKSDKPLDKMTVKELREIAKEIPGIVGVHGMKKDELLAAIAAEKGDADGDVKSAEKSGTTAKKKTGAKKEKVQLTVKEIKGLIKGLKFKRQQALGDKDRKMASIYRRRISRLKKQTRKAA